MRRRGNYFRKPLEWILSAPSMIAVIRVLKESKEGMSGRAVAREAGFAQQACRETFARLEGLGIIKRLGSGKTQLLQLNFKHVLVKEVLLPMFAKERCAMRSLRRVIREELEDYVLSATIFGSVARDEERPDSDVDILLVIEKGSKEKVFSKVSALGQRVAEAYGMGLSPVVTTVREIRMEKKRSSRLIKNILAEGIDLFGIPLRKVLA